MVAMRREDGTYATPQLKKPLPKAVPAGAPSWMWPAVVLVVALFAIGVAGFLYFTKLELPARDNTPPDKVAAASPIAPSPSPTAAATVAPLPSASASPAPSPANATTAARQPSSSTPSPPGEKFVPEDVPFIGERVRANLVNEYVGGPDHKAFALTTLGVPGFVVGQPSEEAARNAALELCQKRADNSQAGGGRRCEIYAVGNIVVYQHGRPPLPPQPWIRHDPSTGRPFASRDMPLIRDAGKARLEAMFVPARKSRTIALGPGGQFIFNSNAESVDESARRALESCAALANAHCMIVAADDSFVVPVPSIMKATGFFHAAANPSIIADARDDVARKLSDATSGWNAVAVGTQGRPGLGLKAATEQAALNDALSFLLSSSFTGRRWGEGPSPRDQLPEGGQRRPCAVPTLAVQMRRHGGHASLCPPYNDEPRTGSQAGEARTLTSQTAQTASPLPGTHRAGTARPDQGRGRGAPSARHRTRPAGRCARRMDRSRCHPR